MRCTIVAKRRYGDDDDGDDDDDDDDSSNDNNNGAIYRSDVKTRRNRRVERDGMERKMRLDALRYKNNARCPTYARDATCRKILGSRRPLNRPGFRPAKYQQRNGIIARASLEFVPTTRDELRARALQQQRRSAAGRSRNAVRKTNESKLRDRTRSFLLSIIETGRNAPNHGANI